MGLAERGIAAEKRAIELDPLAFIDRLNLTFGYVSTGRDAEGIEAAKTALAIQPGNLDALTNLCTANAGIGHLEDAQKVRAQIAAVTTPQSQFPLVQCDFYIDFYKKDFAKARQIVDGGARADWQANGISAVDIATVIVSSVIAIML